MLSVALLLNRVSCFAFLNFFLNRNKKKTNPKTNEHFQSIINSLEKHFFWYISLSYFFKRDCAVKLFPCWLYLSDDILNNLSLAQQITLGVTNIHQMVSSGLQDLTVAKNLTHDQTDPMLFCFYRIIASLEKLNHLNINRFTDC